MSSDLMQEVLQMIETEARSRPTGVDYELAYQVRVAIDRIRFAIKQTEQFAPHTDQMKNAGLQLLDALDRLQSAERRFQQRFRMSTMNGQAQQTESIDGDLKTRAGGGRL